MQSSHFPKSSRSCISLAMLTIAVIFCAQSLAAESAVSASSSDFAGLAQAKFKQWDLNMDGSLCQQEIDSALEDGNNKGKEACILSALKKREAREDSPVQQDNYSLDFFRQLGEDPSKARPYLSRYKRALIKLANTSRVVFASGTPHLEKMQQGKTGDCYLIAAIGSLVNSRPEAIRSFFAANPPSLIDSKTEATQPSAKQAVFEVSFPGHATISVPGPTDGELVAYSDATTDGIWLSLLEKAFAGLKLQERSDQSGETQLYKNIRGGRPSEAIKLLTGHSVSKYSFNNPETRKKLPDLILQAVSERRIMVTSIRNMHKDGKSSGHSLALLGLDQQNNTVTLWNPWGSSKIYKSVGLKMTQGRFSMPVDAWLARFKSLTVENRI